MLIRKRREEEKKNDNHKVSSPKEKRIEFEVDVWNLFDDVR